MANTIFIIIICILVFEYLLERYLAYLNSTYWSDELPKDLEGIYDAEKYKKSQDYLKTKHKFSVITSSFSVILILFVLFFNGFAFVDDFVRQYTTNSILMALLFFGIIAFASDILSTPFSVYGTFVIEQKFGFNRTTPKTFVFDKIKGWLLSILLGGGLLSVIIWVYNTTGNYFWIWAWIIISLFSVFMAMFYSTLIVPLFNKQTPLEHGELREAIEEFANRAAFKLANIFVIDGSKRSSKANAYFSGFGMKKRIVLYDTLIKKHSTGELVAVLAHEIGHYKMKHTLIGLTISVIQTGLMLLILSFLIRNPVLSQALGTNNHSFHLAILVFGILYSPLSLVLGLIMNVFSRKFEYNADRFAGEKYNPEALQSALRKLSVDNFSNLRPHPLYVFFHYSHPPLLKRLEALRRLEKQNIGINNL